MEGVDHGTSPERSGASPPPEIRPLHASDGAAVRALIFAEVGGTPYADRPLELLDTALDGTTDEARALVAVRGNEVVGAVLYGSVAGTIGTGKLHLACATASARLERVGRRLCDAALAELLAGGARLAVVEIPDDPRLAPTRELLRRTGFVEEARVPDLYEDGVALVILRRELRGVATTPDVP